MEDLIFQLISSFGQVIVPFIVLRFVFDYLREVLFARG